VRVAEERFATMLFMNDSPSNPSPKERGERTLRELRDERDRLLAAGRLRLAAELTTWIDELMAESCSR
jgi:hypothetical protein